MAHSEGTKQFDPFGALSRHIPERHLHRIIRIAAAVFFLFMLTRRVGEYRFFYLKTLWAVETLIFLVLAAAFFLRSDPVDRSRGVRDVVIPLVGGILPFALLRTPPAAWVVQDRVYLLAAFWWMTAATALTVWGMWTLRRSFSITVEARSLVTAGPYRFVRHPIYLGEMLAAASVAFWRFSVLNCAVLALFIFIQLSRARWEEEKLERNFPEYREFARNTWWIINGKE